MNIDLYDSQITLKHNPAISPELPDFHFGVNLTLAEFNRIVASVLERGRAFVAVKPEIWDAGTPLERKKMYLKDPSGYLIELKGYRPR